MNKLAPSFLATSLLTLCLPPAAGLAQEKPRSDKHYAGLLVTALEHRSLGYEPINPYTKEDGWSQAGTLVIGGHITKFLHAEIRLGGGFNDAEISGGDLNLSIDYFASWYMGAHYPITNYANIYLQGGFSHVSGKAELDNPDQSTNRKFRYLDNSYPGSSFSISWLAGVDFEVSSNTFLVFEGGRLFEDTESKANAFQFSSGLRYEF